MSGTKLLVVLLLAFALCWGTFAAVSSMQHSDDRFDCAVDTFDRTMAGLPEREC